MHITTISNCSVPTQWQTVVVFSTEAGYLIGGDGQRAGESKLLVYLRLKHEADREEELWRDVLFQVGRRLKMATYKYTTVQAY